MKSRHSKPRRPAGSGVRVPVTLFSGSPEAQNRRLATLDAIDLVALAGEGGWISFLAWAERNEYDVPTGVRTRRGPVKFAAARQWERLKARLRANGIEVESRAPAEYSDNGGAHDHDDSFSRTAMRFTVDGWDRLQALTKALDDWLCSKREETL